MNEIEKTQAVESQMMSVTEVVDQVNRIQEVMRQVMKKDIHYGVIPGTKKPTLYKPGSEKILVTFRLGVGDPQIDDLSSDDHIRYRVVIPIVHIPTGMVMGHGIGECSSEEEKYQWRKPVCGEEFDDTDIDRRREVWKKIWNKQKRVSEAKKIKQVRTNPPDQANTILKMAKKRCLGSTTPVLAKTHSGIVSCNLSQLYSMMKVTSRPIHLPAPGGRWVAISAMTREKHKICKQITLADGQTIYASIDHRFPTKNGLTEAADLQVGDVLKSARPSMPYSGPTMDGLGWLIGFFIAEGHISRPNTVKFTIHANETHFANKILDLAAKLGCTGSKKNRKGTKAADVIVCGAAFEGLMKQFVSGDTCYDKHLKKSAWRQGAGFLEGVLQGWIDGDGHLLLRKGRRQNRILFGFTGKNARWAADLRALAATLGWRIRITRGTSTCGGKTFKTFEGWLCADSPAYNGKEMTELVAIKNRKSMVLYDLQVESASHLFLLATGIVSHNSQIDGTLTVTAASDIFDQDLEDLPPEQRGDDRQAPAPPQRQSQQAPPTQPPVQDAPPQDPPPQGEQGPPEGQEVISEPQRRRLYAIWKASGWQEHQVKDIVAEKWGYTSSKDIFRGADYDAICKYFEDNKQKIEDPPEDDAVPF